MRVGARTIQAYALACSINDRAVNLLKTRAGDTSKSVYAAFRRDVYARAIPLEILRIR